jgi:hypothetical protein
MTLIDRERAIAAYVRDTIKHETTGGQPPQVPAGVTEQEAAELKQIAKGKAGGVR